MRLLRSKLGAMCRRHPSDVRSQPLGAVTNDPCLAPFEPRSRRQCYQESQQSFFLAYILKCSQKIQLVWGSQNQSSDNFWEVSLRQMEAEPR